MSNISQIAFLRFVKIAERQYPTKAIMLYLWKMIQLENNHHSTYSYEPITHFRITAFPNH